MNIYRGMLVLFVLVAGLNSVWGQEASTPQSASPPQTEPSQPAVPAYGPDSPAPPINDNPRISGIDMPNLQPHAAPLSYLQAGAHFSESVDSNVENNLGGSQVSSITDALGSLELQRLWSNYDLSLDYLGGIGYYSVGDVGLRQIEELGVNQKITWKRGELGIRDAFSYQPEGTFGGAYGSVGTEGAALGGQSAFFGGNALGALGQVPRIMNLTLVDVVENLTPKSSVTVTGGHGFVHFLDNEPAAGNAFIGNTQITGEVGFARVLGPHDQGALVYGYQGFKFSTQIDFHSHVIQLMWGHRISGRMDFVIGAGPQFTELDLNGSNDLRITVAGRASLRYQFPKTSLDLSYDHYITNGAGFFSGAESDVARLTATRPMGRVWTVFADFGYSRNTRFIPETALQIAICTPTATNPNPGSLNPAECPGTIANTYDYGFAGAGMRRNLGRHFKVYASYQFNELSFDTSFCGSTGPCSRISQRNVGTIGLDWIPRPIRLD